MSESPHSHDIIPYSNPFSCSETPVTIRGFKTSELEGVRTTLLQLFSSHATAARLRPSWHLRQSVRRAVWLLPKSLEVRAVLIGCRFPCRSVLTVKLCSVLRRSLLFNYLGLERYQCCGPIFLIWLQYHVTTSNMPQNNRGYTCVEADFPLARHPTAAADLHSQAERAAACDPRRDPVF